MVQFDLMSEAPLRVAVVVGRDGAAAEQIVRSLPAQPGIALVFAMSDARQLAKRLRDAAPVPVVDVQRSMTLQPEHIYVLPKDREIAIHKSWLAIDQPDGQGSRDRLLRSLADSLGPDCAAVILAGRGSDGVLGAKRVKEAGGITICQLAGEDETNELPRMASATGIIDLVLPIIEIGPRLVSLTRESDAEATGEPLGAEGTGDGKAFADILTMIYARTGNDFTAYKRGTLFRRLLRRMHIAEVGSIDAYKRHLHDHPTELDRLFRDFLISVTDFFRDPQTFEQLANDIVPRLFKGRGAGDQVRVWVPGCATGEEAYSIAMLMSEHASRLRNAPSIQIFATDIDEDALREARAGIYPDAIATDVSDERLQRFFTHEQDHFRVNTALRDLIVFSAHNLLRDPPFSRLELVSCRGVLLDLNDEAQERALETFHFALRPDGLLLLGPGERARDAQFAPLDEEHHIYQRRTSPFRRMSPRAATGPVAVPATPIDPGELHDRALAEHAPPSVLIDSAHDVLHTKAPGRAYFKYSAGELTRNILRLVHPALSPALGRAIYAAREPTRGTVIRTVRFDDDGRQRCVEVRVRTVTQDEQRTGLMLVMFDDLESGDVDTARAPQHVERMIGELEEDLRITRDQLRMTVEQYEIALHELGASNEALNAMNEELRAATEEVEVGREELHAVNEELLELNRELKAKVTEIMRVNADLRNLMASTEVGALFVDRKLKIQRFTRRAQKLFNVIDSDIGRALTDITHRLIDADLGARMSQAIAAAQPSEHEIRGEDGRSYFMRITPYRSAEQAIEGAVLTFVDITGERALTAALRAASIVLIHHDANLAIIWSSVAARRDGSLADVFSAEHAERYAALVRQVRDTGRGAVAEVDVAIDGVARTFAFRIEPTLENARVAAVTAMGIEVTR